MDEKERLVEYAIPDNIFDTKRIFGFRRRNWIEGLICAGIMGFIIMQIPFVPRVKLIFLVCLCVPILLLNLVGIKDQSVIEAIMNLKVARINKGQYHLRRPNEDERYKTKRMEQSINGVNNGDSAADKTLAFIKGKIDEFKSKNG